MTSGSYLELILTLLAEHMKATPRSEELEREYIRAYIEDRTPVEDAENYYGMFLAKMNEDPIDISSYLDHHMPEDRVEQLSIMIALYEIIAVDYEVDEEELAILNQIQKHFQLSHRSVKTLDCVYFESDIACLKLYPIFILHNNSLHLNIANLSGELIFFEIDSRLFIRNSSSEIIVLNDSILRSNHTSIFADHAILEVGTKTILFEDINRIFHPDQIPETNNIKTFTVENLSHRYGSTGTGLDRVSLSLEIGDFLIVIGKSGTGKTTLVNAMNGGLRPKNIESVKVNGDPLYSNFERWRRYIGNVPQDDLLMENLTVYENLYFNCRLRYPEWTRAKIEDRVYQVIRDLELQHAAHQRVGSPLHKILSGGERKRLNIGLELIGDVDVLFLDEPTSGLSSKDSENIITLLKKMSYRGKMVVCVLHQPSTKIYRQFNKVMVLETGGRMVFYGGTLEAIRYFAGIDNYTNKPFCNACGNVNPEIIFDVLNERIRSVSGEITHIRRRRPEEWQNMFFKYQEQMAEQDVVIE